MSHNPLASELADAQTTLAELRDRRRALDQELRWHAQFDAGGKAADLRALTERHAALHAASHESQSRVDEAQNVLHECRAQTSWGWNPARWFAERGAAKQRYAEQEAVVEDLIARHRDLVGQLADLDRRRARLEHDLRRYAGIDAVNGPGRLAQLDREIAARDSAVAELARRKERVDQRLAPLLRQLHERENEAARLDEVLELAESFQQDLDFADNGYERKLVHEQCEEELGRSSPGAVIREVRPRRRGLARDVEKLRRRIAEEARRSARDVRAVVVDGNNLCYDRSEFIGLTALIPVSDALSRTYDVTVVFDGSIQTRWRFDEDMLASSLPAAKVHVVKSKRAADELILDAARDPYTVVLSNDRFGEFQDKDAVRDGRLVRHDILKGRVCVPDLEVDEPLADHPRRGRPATRQPRQHGSPRGHGSSAAGRAGRTRQ